MAKFIDGETRVSVDGKTLAQVENEFKQSGIPYTLLEQSAKNGVIAGVDKSFNGVATELLPMGMESLSLVIESKDFEMPYTPCSGLKLFYLRKGKVNGTNSRWVLADI